MKPTASGSTLSKSAVALSSKSSTRRWYDGGYVTLGTLKAQFRMWLTPHAASAGRFLAS